MLAPLFLLLAISVNALVHPEHEFTAFKTKYNKVYESPQIEAAKFRTFSANLADYARQQRNAEMTYTVGVTQFSDLTEQEFKATYLGGVKRPAAGSQVS